MTDARATQVALEEWAPGTPGVQATQAALEQWAAVGTAPSTVVVTLVAIEQWATLLIAGVPTGPILLVGV
jgi:hypothetical protein